MQCVLVLTPNFFSPTHRRAGGGRAESPVSGPEAVVRCAAAGQPQEPGDRGTIG